MASANPSIAAPTAGAACLASADYLVGLLEIRRLTRQPAEVQSIQFGEQFHQWVLEPAMPVAYRHGKEWHKMAGTLAQVPRQRRIGGSGKIKNRGQGWRG